MLIIFYMCINHTYLFLCELFAYISTNLITEVIIFFQLIWKSSLYIKVIKLFVCNSGQLHCGHILPSSSTSVGRCQQWWPPSLLKVSPPLAPVKLPSEFHCKTEHLSLKDPENSQMSFAFASPKIKGSEKSCRMQSMWLHTQCHLPHTLTHPPSLLSPLWGKNKDDKTTLKFP